MRVVTDRASGHRGPMSAPGGAVPRTVLKAVRVRVNP